MRLVNIPPEGNFIKIPFFCLLPGVRSMPTADDDDMQNDDDYNYDDESAQDQKSNENNSVAVDRLPTTIGKAKTEYNVIVGESVRLDCPVMNKGNAIVMWYKGDVFLTQDQQILEPSNRFKLTPQWSLEIKNVKGSDEGSYQCKIVPGDLTLSIKLLIKRSPEIKIIEGNRDVTEQQLSFREGEKIRLDCQSEDNPQPKYIWSLNGTRLDKQNGVIVEKGTLIIESAEPHHSDIFQCLAENSFGLLTHKTVAIHVDCKKLETFC